ncbi:MAG: hypothetical protein ACYSU7_18055 [Planctomycetota bacterium]|jgi:hypothetical protein
MRRIVGSAALLLALALAAPAMAGGPYREFSGKVDRINKEKLIVDNRMGDKVTFIKVDETVVQGEKTSWGKLKKEDWVTVSWKMMDKPRKAYIVQVNPPQKEAGEDVE